ncbi:MAG: ankyrin repeat domain-containing protein [Aureispira sp.]|nr:ankyrin repeat domain-containing protein [Aureispira sp.]
MQQFSVFSIFLFFISTTFINAQSFEENQARVYQLDTFTTAQWKAHIDAGNDMNEVLYMEGKTEYTVFNLFAHGYGFYCQDDRKDLVYQVVKTTKKPLITPFFFLDDACWERAKDVMEYYSLLIEHEHKLKEADFKSVYDTYFSHEDTRDYVDLEKKTMLIYACQFDYTKTAQQIIKTAKKSLNHVDKTGKNALFYACENGNLTLIKSLIDKGIKVDRKDKTGKKAIDYCKSKDAQKVLKKVMRKKKK